MRRIPEKSVLDVGVLAAILDAGVIAHVGIADEAQPYVVPVAYARDGDRVLIHGSTASRLFRRLADGADACFTVTLLDGLVVARSAFESSMHYRSVMALGRFRALEGEEHLAGVRLITEHLIPGRWNEVRPPLEKELRATAVLAMTLDETSVKVSDGLPDDPEDDIAGDAWAGILPMHSGYGAAVPSPDLRVGIPIPASVHRLNVSAEGGPV